MLPIYISISNLRSDQVAQGAEIFEENLLGSSRSGNGMLCKKSLCGSVSGGGTLLLCQRRF